VVYNKVGDLRSSITSAFSYPFQPLINYPPLLPLSIPILFIMFFSFESLFLPLSLTIIFFPKSAQLPLPSRSSNTTPAPTPVSPPPHSPTMVIAGVYLGSIMQPIIMLVIDPFSLVVVILLVVPLYPLIRSIFKAISLSDMKSMIAFPTIIVLQYVILFGSDRLCRNKVSSSTALESSMNSYSELSSTHSLIGTFGFSQRIVV
jgi:hypothetical protein